MEKPISFDINFSRAARFVIRQPVIWLLSFIIAFGLGNLTQWGYGQLLNPSGRSFPLLYHPLIADVPRFDLPPMLNSNAPSWPVGLAMILMLWLGALVAQAMLILISARLALGQSPQFSVCLARGVRRTWRLMVVNLLVFGPFYGLLLIYMLALINSPTGQIPAAFEQIYWDRQIVQAGGQYSISQVTLCTILPLNILALIVYPPCVVAAILEDMSLWRNLRLGWRLLWANLGRLLGFWALLAGAGLVTSYFLLASASTIGRLLADSATVVNAAIILVGLAVTILIGLIFTVAGVQLYVDCARRLRSTPASNISTPLAT